MSDYEECESRGTCDDVRDRLTEAEAEIERLRAALKPFAMCAGGMILNPEPQDWQRAKEAMGMVPAEANEQPARSCALGKCDSRNLCDRLNRCKAAAVKC